MDPFEFIDETQTNVRHTIIIKNKKRVHGANENQQQQQQQQQQQPDLNPSQVRSSFCSSVDGQPFFDSSNKKLKTSFEFVGPKARSKITRKGDEMLNLLVSQAKGDLKKQQPQSSSFHQQLQQQQFATRTSTPTTPTTSFIESSVVNTNNDNNNNDSSVLISSSSVSQQNKNNNDDNVEPVTSLSPTSTVDDVNIKIELVDDDVIVQQNDEIQQIDSEPKEQQEQIDEQQNVFLDQQIENQTTQQQRQIMYHQHFEIEK